MKLKAIILGVMLFCGVLSFAKTPKAAHAQAQNSAPAPQREDELSKGLRDDIARMEALVQQMDVNLAQVDVTQSPLKHQLQLEIDAWRVMIASMKRRLGEKR